MHITLKRGEVMANSCSIDVLVKLFPKIPTCIMVRTDGCHRYGEPQVYLRFLGQGGIKFILSHKTNKLMILDIEC